MVEQIAAAILVNAFNLPYSSKFFYRRNYQCTDIFSVISKHYYLIDKGVGQQGPTFCGEMNLPTDVLKMSLILSVIIKSPPDER